MLKVLQGNTGLSGEVSSYPRQLTGGEFDVDWPLGLSPGPAPTERADPAAATTGFMGMETRETGAEATTVRLFAHLQRSSSSLHS